MEIVGGEFFLWCYLFTAWHRLQHAFPPSSHTSLNMSEIEMRLMETDLVKYSISLIALK